MPDQLPPAGWFSDGSGRSRWWDGQRWTDRYRPDQPRAAGWAWNDNGELHYWDGERWAERGPKPQYAEPIMRRPRRSHSRVGFIVVVVIVLVVGGGLIASINESQPGSSTSECVRSDGDFTNGDDSINLTTVDCDDDSAEFKVGQQVDDPEDCLGAKDEIVYMTKDTKFDGKQKYCLEPLE